MFLSGQRPRNARSSSILAHHLHLTRPRSTSRFHRSPPITCPRQRNGKRTLSSPDCNARVLRQWHCHCMPSTATVSCRSACLAPPLDDQLYDSSVPCDIYNDVLLHCATINISVTEDQVQYVVQQTVKQSKSKLWFSMRAGRVTASTFYAACHTRIEKPAMSVLRSICTPNAHRFSSAATEWGNTHESVAQPVRGPSHCPTHRRCVSLSGVRAVPQHCVPDVRRQPGWASPVHMLWEGLVEIKCPYTLRESSDFGQLAWMCLVDDKYCLSRNHRHFFQVQMQLFAANKSYCDFVAWSPEGLFVERIYPDREWWVTWSGQGMLFHSKCVMPELCAQYFSKKAILATTTSTSQNVIVAASESVASGNYCVCQGGDDGTTMIYCDDENCSVQWFHTRCMKLKRVPKGKWFCPQCKPTKRK